MNAALPEGDHTKQAVAKPAQIVVQTTTTSSDQATESSDNNVAERPYESEADVISALGEEVKDEVPEMVSEVKGAARVVPFYSQFADISNVGWQKVSCGVAALAMLIDYYTDPVAPDILLAEGRASGAYITSAGWSHQGLINLATDYELTGYTQGLGHLTPDEAFAALVEELEVGPVMASVYYTFTPGHPIPHLVVINDVQGDTVYYNDPAEPGGGGTISVDDFKPAWKQRYIAIRP